MEPRETDQPTVEQSLEMLSDALSKASADLCYARLAIDNDRCDLASRNTSVPRKVIRDVDRVVKDLRDTDEHLRGLVRDLSERD
jgi:hypothetical protein